MKKILLLLLCACASEPDEGPRGVCFVDPGWSVGAVWRPCESEGPCVVHVLGEEESFQDDDESVMSCQRCYEDYAGGQMGDCL